MKSVHDLHYLDKSVAYVTPKRKVRGTSTVTILVDVGIIVANAGIVKFLEVQANSTKVPNEEKGYDAK